MQNAALVTSWDLITSWKPWWFRHSFSHCLIELDVNKSQERNLLACFNYLIKLRSVI